MTFSRATNFDRNLFFSFPIQSVHDTSRSPQKDTDLSNLQTRTYDKEQDNIKTVGHFLCILFLFQYSRSRALTLFFRLISVCLLEKRGIQKCMQIEKNQYFCVRYGVLRSASMCAPKAVIISATRSSTHTVSVCTSTASGSLVRQAQGTKQARSERSRSLSSASNRTG